MRRIRGLVKIFLVTSCTRARGIVVIAHVAFYALGGDIQVRSRQDPVIIVVVQPRRTPPGFCGVAGGAVHRKSKRRVIGIYGLIIGLHMAGSAFRRGAGVPARMTADTGGCRVGSRQWKSRAVVIKSLITARVAAKACRARIRITRNARMMIIGLRIGVTGDARKHGIIVFLYMAIFACIPFPLVFSAVDRKILPVVIKRRWNPAFLRMTGCTIR